MRSIERWHFQWPWRTLTRFQGHSIFEVESLKYCAFYGQFLWNTNRKPHPICRMAPLSMTLSDLWPGIQGHDIFWRHSDYCTRRKIPNIWNGTMFGDLDWPLNVSRGFVSISWASCNTMQIGLRSYEAKSTWANSTNHHTISMCSTKGWLDTL